MFGLQTCLPCRAYCQWLARNESVLRVPRNCCSPQDSHQTGGWNPWIQIEPVPCPVARLCSVPPPSFFETLRSAFSARFSTIREICKTEIGKIGTVITLAIDLIDGWISLGKICDIRVKYLGFSRDIKLFSLFIYMDNRIRRDKSIKIPTLHVSENSSDTKELIELFDRSFSWYYFRIFVRSSSRQNSSENQHFSMHIALLHLFQSINLTITNGQHVVAINDKNRNLSV